MNAAIEQAQSSVKRIGLWIGPLVFAIMFLTCDSQQTMPRDAWLVAGVGLWMAIWWSTEAIPVAATAFIPLVSFPLLQVMSIKTVAQSYAHPTIFLFMGAFILALAVEKWSLHRRIALAVLVSNGNGWSEADPRFHGVGCRLVDVDDQYVPTAMMLLPIADISSGHGCGEV